MSDGVAVTCGSAYAARHAQARSTVGAQTLDHALFFAPTPAASPFALVPAPHETYEQTRARHDVLASCLAMVDQCAEEFLHAPEDDAFAAVSRCLREEREHTYIPGVQLFSATTAADDERSAMCSSPLTISITPDDFEASGKEPPGVAASTLLLHRLLDADAFLRATASLLHSVDASDAEVLLGDRPGVHEVRAEQEAAVQEMAAAARAHLQRELGLSDAVQVPSSAAPDLLRRWYALYTRSAAAAQKLCPADVFRHSILREATDSPVIVVLQRCEGMAPSHIATIVETLAAAGVRTTGGSYATAARSVPSFLVMHCSTSRDVFRDVLPAEVASRLALRPVYMTDVKQSCAEFADALLLDARLPVALHAQLTELLRDQLIRVTSSTGWYVDAIKQLIIAHFNPEWPSLSAIASRTTALKPHSSVSGAFVPAPEHTARSAESRESTAINDDTSSMVLPVLCAPLAFWASRFAHAAACRQQSVGTPASMTQTPLWALSTRFAAWLPEHIVRSVMALPSVAASGDFASTLQRLKRELNVDIVIEQSARAMIEAIAATSSSSVLVCHERSAGAAVIADSRVFLSHSIATAAPGTVSTATGADERKQPELARLEQWSDKYLTASDYLAYAARVAADDSLTGIPREQLPLARDLDGAFAELIPIKFYKDEAGGPRALIALLLLASWRRRLGWLTAAAIVLRTAGRPLRDKHGRLSASLRELYTEVGIQKPDGIAVLASACAAVKQADKAALTDTLSAMRAMLATGVGVRDSEPVHWAGALPPAVLFASFIQQVDDVTVLVAAADDEHREADSSEGLVPPKASRRTAVSNKVLRISETGRQAQPSTQLSAAKDRIVQLLRDLADAFLCTGRAEPLHEVLTLASSWRSLLESSPYQTTVRALQQPVCLPSCPACQSRLPSACVGSLPAAFEALHTAAGGNKRGTSSVACTAWWRVFSETWLATAQRVVEQASEEPGTAGKSKNGKRRRQQPDEPALPAWAQPAAAKAAFQHAVQELVACGMVTRKQTRAQDDDVFEAHLPEAW